MSEKRLKALSVKQEREGKPAAVQALPFIEEEIRLWKEGSSHVRTRRQAISRGLRRARRRGVPIEYGAFGDAHPARGGASARWHGRP